MDKHSVPLGAAGHLSRPRARAGLARTLGASPLAGSAPAPSLAPRLNPLSAAPERGVGRPHRRDSFVEAEGHESPEPPTFPRREKSLLLRAPRGFVPFPETLAAHSRALGPLAAGWAGGSAASGPPGEGRRGGRPPTPTEPGSPDRRVAEPRAGPPGHVAALRARHPLTSGPPASRPGVEKAGRERQPIRGEGAAAGGDPGVGRAGSVSHPSRRRRREAGDARGPRAGRTAAEAGG